jgi:hypothetical protein
LLEAASRVVCSTVKFPVVNSTSEKTAVKFTHACFHLTHSYTRTSVDLSVDLPSAGSVKKFTDSFFVIDTPACLKTSKRTLLNKIMSIFEVWKHSTINCTLLKSI